MQDARTTSEKTMENSIATMPDTMSCSGALDQAMACGAFAGSFRSLYRYGKWRDCSQQWSDFWFCMRTRSRPEEIKRQAIRERYWEKEQMIRSRPNSEDVWQERTERVTNLFQRDPNKDGVFDGLWARPPAELERLNRAKFQEPEPRQF